MQAIMTNTPGELAEYRYVNSAEDYASAGMPGRAADPLPEGTRFTKTDAEFEALLDAAEGDPSLVRIAPSGSDLVLHAPTPAEKLAAARAEKLAALKALRDAVQYDAFEYEGHWIDCDQDSRANLTGFQLSVVSGADPFPYQWRSADNVWLPVPDREAWAALMEQFEMHVKAAWTAFAAHEAQILASPDPAAHDIASGEWPDTRIDKSAY